MIVRFRHQPYFVWHPRRVRTKCVIVPGVIYYPFGLANLLTQNVAKNATLAVAIPFARSAQLVENPPRHKGCRSDLRMRVRPLFSRLCALVLENCDVFESSVTL